MFSIERINQSKRSNDFGQTSKLIALLGISKACNVTLTYNFNHFYGSFRVEIDISSTPLQKKPVKGVIRKRCSKSMHQIYRRTPMPKCDFNKATLLISYFGMGVLL